MTEDRMLKAKHSNYLMAEYAGHNDALEHPVGHLILVKVDQASEKIGNTGALIQTQKAVETMARAVTTGVIVAMGDNAFTTAADRIRAWTGLKPKVGDRITFKRYEGEEFQDGRPFQYMPDTAVRGIHFSEKEPKQ